MGVSIDSFKRYTEYLANKKQSGNSLTPTQFNEAANRAQMQVFEKDRAIFIAEGVASDFLRTFLTKKIYNGPFVASEIKTPDNLEHITSIRSYHVKEDGKGFEVPVDEVNNASWGEIQSSSLYEATSRFPKYSEFGNIIRLKPSNLQTITLDYFRTPVAPKWEYTTTNNRPVYDPANSVDFEWDDFATNNVAAYFLALVGVNLKDGELSQFSQNYKQETNSII